MRVPRIYIRESLAKQSHIVGDAHIRHYLVSVLRLKASSAITLFCGDGREYSATISAIDKKTVTFDILSSKDCSSESPLLTILVQAIGKGERMDFAVQKATELGVTIIAPVTSEHGAVKLTPDRMEKRTTHWQDVAINAAQQCGRTSIPIIEPCVPLIDYLVTTQSRRTHKIMLHPYNAGKLQHDIESQNGIEILIGPEGGLSDNEYKKACDAGFSAVSMGPRILRTETACISAMTLVQHFWGDLAKETNQ